MKELTPKQARFVDEYLIDLNATQAAIRAGYSEKTAEKIGSENLKKPEIAAELERLRNERSTKTRIDAAWLLERLSQEATADIGDLYNEDGSIKPMSEWPLIWRQGLVAGIKHQELRDDEGNRTGEFIIDVKLSDRIRRLELIGKHIGVKAFEDTINVKGLDQLADRLARAAQRNG